jgi:hypothetical protein
MDNLFVFVDCSNNVIDYYNDLYINYILIYSNDNIIKENSNNQIFLKHLKNDKLIGIYNINNLICLKMFIINNIFNFSFSNKLVIIYNKKNDMIRYNLKYFNNNIENLDINNFNNNDYCILTKDDINIIKSKIF